MIIEVTRSCAGPGFTHKRGQELEVGVDIPRDRALMLLNGGIAVPAVERAVETADYPKHVGGGWYLLADGRKVRKSELETRDG